MSVSWLILHTIGIIAYAASGAFVALDQKFSFIGIYVLGMATSFAGGIIRNTILGQPVTFLWSDRMNIILVFVTLTIIVFLPIKVIQHTRRWFLFFDSIGLASFAITGALEARRIENDLGLIILASLFTGLGGGMIRDVLADRKPIALKAEIHAILTSFCGACIWFNLTGPIHLIFIVIVVIVIRMLAIRYDWHFPLPIYRIRE